MQAAPSHYEPPLTYIDFMLIKRDKNLATDAIMIAYEEDSCTLGPCETFYLSVIEEEPQQQQNIWRRIVL